MGPAAGGHHHGALDPMLHLIDLSKFYGPRELFSGLSWHISPGQRVGLVGRNGVGKTTLFRIIAGIESSDTGEVVQPKHVRIGYLQQEAELLGDATVLDTVTDGAAEVKALGVERERLEERLATEEATPELLARYETVESRFRALDGYRLEAAAQRILAGLGFSEAAMDGLVSELSGGWRMRVALSRLLLARPEMLLLDEPTNHLDLESLAWFENYLLDYPGSFILISHDRALLERVPTHIAEMTTSGVALYTGNFNDYEVEREERRALLASSARNQAKAIARDEAFVERFRYKATKAKAAQSRIKKLNKIERIEGPESDAQAMRFQFPEAPRSGKEVAICKGLKKAYGDHIVYDGLDLVLRRGERVALVGPNGAGKSTLLKMLAGAIAPDAGSLELGHNVVRTYFAQHQVDVLDVRRTVLEELEAVADFDALPRCRGILGAFRFSGKDVEKKVGVLSGGEKARLAMARMMLGRANFMLLDEPTNHLDMASRAVLVQALAAFEGTLVVISHDRAFLDATVDTVFEVRDGAVSRHDGDYSMWHAVRKSLDLAASEAAKASQVGGKVGARVNAKELKRLKAEARNAHSRTARPHRDALAAIEARISEVEARSEAIEALMLEPDFYEDAEGMRRIYEERAALETEQEDLLERWEAAGEAVEAAAAELQLTLDSLEGRAGDGP